MSITTEYFQILILKSNKILKKSVLKQEFKEQYLQYYQQVNCYIGKRTGFK